MTTQRARLLAALVLAAWLLVFAHLLATGGVPS